MIQRHPFGRLGGGGVTLLLIGITVGCSRGPTVTGDEPIQVQTSSFGVTVENRCGSRISDITVEIVPYGAATTYTVRHYGMQNLEKRDFSLNEFRARDGMPLDLRVARVKSVRVTATDFNGKPVQVEFPWR